MEKGREEFLRNLLDTYSFEEILEMNDLEIIDVLDHLYENGLLELYYPPVDYE